MTPTTETLAAILWHGFSFVITAEHFKVPGRYLAALRTAGLIQYDTPTGAPDKRTTIIWKEKGVPHWSAGKSVTSYRTTEAGKEVARLLNPNGAEYKPAQRSDDPTIQDNTAEVAA